jgi:hypothetical protein
MGAAPRRRVALAGQGRASEAVNGAWSGAVSMPRWHGERAVQPDSEREVFASRKNRSGFSST